MNNSILNNRGFVALLTTIILTIVLMIVMFTTSMSTFFARFDALGNENKAMSSSLAAGCANIALAKIIENYDYLGNETIDVDSTRKCSISTIIYGQSDTSIPVTESKLAIIKTSSQYPSLNGSWSTTIVNAIVKNKNSSISPSKSESIKIVSWD